MIPPPPSLQAAVASPPAQAAAARGPDVIVTAPRAPTLHTVQRQTEAITPAVESGYARLEAPVCPEAKGLDPAIAEAVERHIREDAAAAGLAVGKPGCAPNLAVMLVADGRAVVREALSRRPWLFDGVASTDQAALARLDGPVRAWSTIRVLGAWDDELQPGAKEGPPTLNPGFQSRVRLTVRHAIVGTTVLIDAAAAGGKSARQIAGYAVMRGLAGAKPPPSASVDTVLALFAGGPAADGLTAFDLAYLKALYNGPGNYDYHEKTSGMALTIQRELARTAAAASPGASAP